MIRNGRAYTKEDGVNDIAHITSHTPDEIIAVGEWIRREIRPAETVLETYSSYALKHLLERDIHLYLTNNEFKDAMLLAGFKPVSPGEVNWHFRIALTRNTNVNNSPFFHWAKQFVGEKSSYGDFADAMVADLRFPVFAEHDAILYHLEAQGACDHILEAFEVLWKQYKAGGRKPGTGTKNN